MPVKFNFKIKAFTVDGKAYPGVHPTLRSVFYAKYSYERAIYGPHNTHTKENATNKKRPIPGMQAGITLDREITRTIKLKKQFNCKNSVFYNITEREQFIKRHCLNQKQAKALRTRISLDAKKIWKTLDLLRLDAIDAQVAVGCKTMKIATGVDLLAKDQQGRFVVIELKRGFENSYHLHTNNNMKCLTGELKDSQANQHQLQVLVTSELFKRTFPEKAVANPIVLVVNKFGVDIIPLAEELSAQRTRIINLICNRT